MRYTGTWPFDVVGQLKKRLIWSLKQQGDRNE
jgi:hypothetical protein